MRPDWPTALMALLALAAPQLLAYTLSPSATFLNQMLAIAGWGAVLYWLREPRAVPGAGAGLNTASQAWRAVALPQAVLGLLALAVGSSWLRGLPGSLALEALLLLGCASAVLRAAQSGAASHSASQDGRPSEGPLVRPVLAGLLLGACLSSVIAVIQVFFPEWADGHWICRSGLPGRAVGNLRQPNHLSTLLLWGLIASVPLLNAALAKSFHSNVAPADAASESATSPRQPLGAGWLTALGLSLGGLLCLGLVLTASRTGILGLLLLAGWGALDRGLLRRVRLMVGLAPLAYLIFWLALAAWAHQTEHTFGGEARLAESDLSASRFDIWSNTLAMIAAQPWAGVGFGQFNFAWTLTPFPGRPVAFFDHTHNLLLQFAAELGIPAALLLAGLLAAALFQAGQRSARVKGSAGIAQRAALVIVLLAGLHSLLEYPLWYSYFLLPTAWALGHALRRPSEGMAGAGLSVSATVGANVNTGLGAAAQARSPAPTPAWGLNIAGALMLAGAMAACWSYAQVALIYQPGDSPLTLEQRIAQGQASWLFAHHANYAAATVGPATPEILPAVRSTSYSLLDARLMIAWAKALEASGEPDKARYLAARLREFRNPSADTFFAPCQADAPQPKPFQCEAPQATLTWRDFQAQGQQR